MQPKSDAQLLREYVQNGAESAFAEIVARHTNLVYSAALRQVDSPDIAAEVAQSVFIGLARGARSLSPKLAGNGSLAGWLCRSARNISLNLRRDEFRRHSRERQAMENLDSTPDTTSDWERLRPVLDEAMAELSESDYDALVLRFFKNQDLRSVGLGLGVSDDAAQKRVSRALDKLRDLLSQRGITTSAAALSVVLAANACQAAPVGLAATLSAASLASAAAGTGTTIREADGTVRQQVAASAPLQAEHERLSSLAALLSRPSVNTGEELQRLRDEVAALREQNNDLAALREEDRQLQASLNRARTRFREDLHGPQDQQTVDSPELNARTDYCMRLGGVTRGYASQHRQFPTNLAQVAGIMSTEYGNRTNFANFSPDQFEIVFQGPLPAPDKYAHPNDIILIRQKHPWKNTDGKWVKVYTMLGGIGMQHSEADGNFDAWEKRRIVPPEASK
ncbi:MAG: hypothetical protein DME22_04300 [Verrucomicrobia bacterium]|nr:MAG: hypothetical protein DME22_04300 [Verrucomicrobiota bacterium]